VKANIVYTLIVYEVCETTKWFKSIEDKSIILQFSKKGKVLQAMLAFTVPVLKLHGKLIV